MRRLLVLSALVLAVPAAIAQEPLPKQEIIDRSAGICRDLNADVAPHARKIENADGPNELVRHGRRFVRR